MFSCFKSSPLDKGRQKVIKHLDKIIKFNDKNITNSVEDILRLNKIIVSDVTVYDKHHSETIKIHLDTFNFYQSTSALLMCMLNIQEKYPFIDIHVSLYSSNSVHVTFNWDDYLDHCIREGNPIIFLPGARQTHETIQTILIKNHNKLQAKISEILDDPSIHNLSTNTLHFWVHLDPNTFKFQLGRQHFLNLVIKFKKENPFIEIYPRGTQVLIRVYWGLYNHFLTIAAPIDVAQSNQNAMNEIKEQSQLTQTITSPLTDVLPLIEDIKVKKNMRKSRRTKKTKNNFEHIKYVDSDHQYLTNDTLYYSQTSYLEEDDDNLEHDFNHHDHECI